MPRYLLVARLLVQANRTPKSDLQPKCTVATALHEVPGREAHGVFKLGFSGFCDQALAQLVPVAVVDRVGDAWGYRLEPGQYDAR